MSDVIRIEETHMPALLPLPDPGSLGIHVRDGVPGDLAFIDALQKQHSKAVGWMPTGQLEGHIAKGHVLVAEATSEMSDRGCGIGDVRKSEDKSVPSDIPHTRSQIPDQPTPIGYVIGVDKYFKREDTGVIYQMNIDPGHQRGLVGARLLQAMFDRWPYGVRLCCCWCAQDLAANRFWEAMGFVPLAFRAGSRKRDRVHIFWQKAIRKIEPQRHRGAEEGRGMGADDGSDSDSVPLCLGGSSYWFPSQTGGGALREDRVVLPIPPGSHWRDAKPRVYPGVAGLIEAAAVERKRLAAPTPEEKAAKREARKAAKAQQQLEQSAVAARAQTVAAGGLRFGSGSGPSAGTSDEGLVDHHSLIFG